MAGMELRAAKARYDRRLSGGGSQTGVVSSPSLSSSSPGWGLIQHQRHRRPTSMTDHHEAIAHLLLKQAIENFLYHEVEL